MFVLGVATSALHSLLFFVDETKPAVVAYGIGADVRRLGSLSMGDVQYPHALVVDRPRGLLYVFVRRGKATSVLAIRYDRAGRLTRLAETPVDRAAQCLTFSPSGRYAALLSDVNARTLRVMPDGALRSLDRKTFYGEGNFITVYPRLVDGPSSCTASRTLATASRPSRRSNGVGTGDCGRRASERI